MNDDFKTAPSRDESLSKPPDGQTTRQKITFEDDFRTPEQVAAASFSAPETDILPNTPAHAGHPAKKSQKFKFHWPPGKKEIIVAVIVIIVIGGGITTWLTVFHHTAKPVAAVTQKTPAKPATPAVTTVPSDLTGLQVNPALNKVPVTGVMIENTTDARPQSGLGQAGVVFEAVAEGGVTRFLALYQDTAPSNIGPVRSVRPYYLQWLLGFNAAIAHVGGSTDALSDIKTWGVRDLDQFYNSAAYHRVTTRAAPHNVYTAISTLNQLENSKGYTSSKYTSWPRKADAPSKQPTATTISMTLSSATYNPTYTYSPTTNSYNRDEDGVPQIDANTNTQVSPKVVIAIVVPETRGALDSSGAYYSDYSTIGSGVADIFQDGIETTGQWIKSSNTSQITFSDSSGQPIPLNAGQTWITAITSPGNVTYK